MLSNLYYAGFDAIGITALARVARNGGVILCYHNVVDGQPRTGDPGLHLPLAAFERQMRWLAKHYHVIPLGELARRLAGGDSLRRLAAVTFDDGYTGVFDHAWPLLRELGLPAMVFIPTRLVQSGNGFWWDHPSITGNASSERRQTWLNDLRGDGKAIAEAAFDDAPSPQPVPHPIADWGTIALAAAEGLQLGAHSATHRNLTRITDEELAWEIGESRTRLNAMCGVTADCFAYPYGISDARVHDAVRRAGYRVGVTLEAGLNFGGADPYALRRVNIPASISDAAFKAWIVGLRPAFRGEK